MIRCPFTLIFENVISKKKKNPMLWRSVHPKQPHIYHSRYNAIISRVMNKHDTRAERIHFYYSICSDLFSIFSFYFIFLFLPLVVVKNTGWRFHRKIHDMNVGARISVQTICCRFASLSQDTTLFNNG